MQSKEYVEEHHDMLSFEAFEFIISLFNFYYLHVFFSIFSLFVSLELIYFFVTTLAFSLSRMSVL